MLTCMSLTSISLMACFLHELAKTNKWVSSTLDCGISLQISDTEILLMRLREATKAIKAAYQKDSLQEMMNVEAILCSTIEDRSG